MVPFFNLLLTIVWHLYYFAYDTGFTFNSFKTKQTSMNNYKAIYMGYDFEIQYSFAGVLVITYTTLMYGLSMPILFPLAALSIFCMKLCERVQVAWFYRLPPKGTD